jgi:hypothetical protein
MSLRLRLTVLTGLLSGGTVLLFALVFYLVLQGDLLDQVDGHLRERATQVIQTLTADGDLSNDDRLPPPSALEEFCSRPMGKCVPHPPMRRAGDCQPPRT